MLQEKLGITLDVPHLDKSVGLTVAEAAECVQTQKSGLTLASTSSA